MIGFPGLLQSVAFFSIFSDLLCKMLKNANILSHNLFGSSYFMTIILALLLLYLILQKQIADLKYPSLMHFGGLLLLLSFFLVQLAKGDGEGIGKHQIATMNWDLKFLSSTPTFLLSFGSQMSFLPIVNTSKKKSTRNGLRVAIYTFSTCFLIYFSIAIVSIFLYSTDLYENILDNIQNHFDVLSIMVLLMFLITSAIHIPFVFFIGKDNMLVMFDELMRGTYSAKHERSMSLKENNINDVVTTSSFSEIENSYLSMNPLYYYIITITLYVMVIVLSLVTKGLMLILNIIGANASTCSIYLFPAAFYLK